MAVTAFAFCDYFQLFAPLLRIEVAECPHTISATYITFSLFPIYINRILTSIFPYTRIFNANEPSPALLPPLPLSRIYVVLSCHA